MNVSADTAGATSSGMANAPRETKSGTKAHKWVCLRDFQKNTLCIVDAPATIGSTIFQWTSALPEEIPQREIYQLSFLQYVSKQRPRPISGPETNIDVIIRLSGSTPRYIGCEKDCLLKTVREPNSYCVWAMEAYEDGYFTLQHPTGKFLCSSPVTGVALTEDSSLNWLKLFKMEPVKNTSENNPRKASDPAIESPVAMTDNKRKSTSLGLPADFFAQGQRRTSVNHAATSSPQRQLLVQLSDTNNANGGRQMSPLVQNASTTLHGNAVAKLNAQVATSQVSNGSSNIDVLRATHTPAEITRKLSSRQVDHDVSLPKSNSHNEASYAVAEALRTLALGNNRAQQHEDAAGQKPRLVIDTEDNTQVTDMRKSSLLNGQSMLDHAQPASFLNENAFNSVASSFHNVDAGSTDKNLAFNNARQSRYYDDDTEDGTKTHPMISATTNFSSSNMGALMSSAATVFSPNPVNTEHRGGPGMRQIGIADGDDDDDDDANVVSNGNFSGGNFGHGEFTHGSSKGQSSTGAAQTTKAAVDLNCCVSMQDGRGRMLARRGTGGQLIMRKLELPGEADDAVYFTVHVVALDNNGPLQPPQAAVAPTRVPQLAGAHVVLRSVPSGAYIKDAGGVVAESEGATDLAIWVYSRMPYNPLAFTLTQRSTGRRLCAGGDGTLVLLDSIATGGSGGATCVFMLLVPQSVSEAVVLNRPACDNGGPQMGASQGGDIVSGLALKHASSGAAFEDVAEKRGFGTSAWLTRAMPYIATISAFGSVAAAAVAVVAVSAKTTKPGTATTTTGAMLANMQADDGSWATNTGSGGDAVLATQSVGHDAHLDAYHESVAELEAGNEANEPAAELGEIDETPIVDLNDLDEHDIDFPDGYLIDDDDGGDFEDDA